MGLEDILNAAVTNAVGFKPQVPPMGNPRNRFAGPGMQRVPYIPIDYSGGPTEWMDNEARQPSIFRPQVAQAQIPPGIGIQAPPQPWSGEVLPPGMPQVAMTEPEFPDMGISPQNMAFVERAMRSQDEPEAIHNQQEEAAEMPQDRLKREMLAQMIEQPPESAIKPRSAYDAGGPRLSGNAAEDIAMLRAANAAVPPWESNFKAPGPMPHAEATAYRKGLGEELNAITQQTAAPWNEVENARGPYGLPSVSLPNMSVEAQIAAANEPTIGGLWPDKPADQLMDEKFARAAAEAKRMSPLNRNTGTYGMVKPFHSRSPGEVVQMQEREPRVPTEADIMHAAQAAAGGDVPRDSSGKAIPGISQTEVMPGGGLRGHYDPAAKEAANRGPSQNYQMRQNELAEQKAASQRQVEVNAGGRAHGRWGRMSGAPLPAEVARALGEQDVVDRDGPTQAQKDEEARGGVPMYKQTISNYMGGPQVTQQMLGAAAAAATERDKNEAIARENAAKRDHEIKLEGIKGGIGERLKKIEEGIDPDKPGVGANPAGPITLEPGQDPAQVIEAREKGIESQNDVKNYESISEDQRKKLEAFNSKSANWDYPELDEEGVIQLHAKAAGVTPEQARAWWKLKKKSRTTPKSVGRKAAKAVDQIAGWGGLHAIPGIGLPLGATYETGKMLYDYLNQDDEPLVPVGKPDLSPGAEKKKSKGTYRGKSY